MLLQPLLTSALKVDARSSSQTCCIILLENPVAASIRQEAGWANITDLNFLENRKISCLCLESKDDL